MSANSGRADGAETMPGRAGAGLDAASRREPSRGRRFIRRKIAAAVSGLVLAAGAYLAYDQLRVHRLAGTVRRLVVARRFQDARAPLLRWLAARPASGEAHYYKALLALVADKPAEVVAETGQARSLGFDDRLLDCLTAIYNSRANNINLAEPTLERAFHYQTEPRAEVAKELARIYLSTYRLAQAAEAIERWRMLAPQDPEPYLWSNEIASRSDAEPAVLLRNYRAALERDPALAKAQFGLAEELSKERRFDEADEALHAYLKQCPSDARAFVALGRNAFQRGDLQGSLESFRKAVAIDPHQPDALKELAHADLQAGRLREACMSLELLTEIDPYDYQTRYSFAQVLRRLGQEARFRVENEHAARLRKENDELVQLRQALRKNPNDLATRFEVAKWMLKNGHAEEGLNWTKEILRAEPRHGATHRLLAEYYHARGDSGLANYHNLMASTEQDGGTSSSTPQEVTSRPQ
jgi:tetratricopeptide (TPR) repeat protein